jgi:tetratricopeptide (TPR) repeat protein
LIAEVANLDAARTALRATSNRSDELRVLEALALARSLVGMKEETLRLLEEALASDDLPAQLRSRFEAQAGWVAAQSGRHTRARELALATRERARRADDAAGEIDALMTIAYVAYEQADLTAADAAFHEAELLSRRKVPKKLALVLNDRSVVALERGDYTLARTMLGEAETLSEDIRFGIWGNLALSYLLEGRWSEARPWLVRGLQAAHEVGAMVPILIALLSLAAVAALDDPERGALLCGATESLRADLAIPLQRLELGVLTDARESLIAQLGDRFYELASKGAELELGDAVALALEL